MQTQTERPAAPHNIIMENRRSLTATGVRSIISYDAYAATLETEQGMLQIGGEGLKVSELSTQSGEVKISGSIEYLQYTDRAVKKSGLWHRLVR